MYFDTIAKIVFELGIDSLDTPLENFVAYSDAAFEEFAELLRNGEAEFTYFDYTTQTERKIKAICSQRETDNTSPRYVMLYSVDNAVITEKKEMPDNRKVSIRTFGYFDVFIGEKPIGFLWEDEPVNPITLSRYRKVALRLKNTLEEYGISAVVESVDGKRRIVTELVQCDLYQYLSGKEEYALTFKGSYLTNYSWGENTLGELINYQE